MRPTKARGACGKCRAAVKCTHIKTRERIVGVHIGIARLPRPPDSLEGHSHVQAELHRQSQRHHLKQPQTLSTAADGNLCRSTYSHQHQLHHYSEGITMQHGVHFPDNDSDRTTVASIATMYHRRHTVNAVMIARASAPERDTARPSSKISPLPYVVRSIINGTEKG